MIQALSNWQMVPSKRLGGGGYSQVFLGKSSTFIDRSAAIKVYNNPFYANTFEGEVRILNELAGCPGIPALLDHGRNEDGKLCIVTEYLPGQRLDRHIQTKGPLSLTEITSMLEDILATLSWAHGKNILHKDIKASNLIVHNNRYFLLDWGVAEHTGNGRSESIRAKQDIVAPECYSGQHSPATDFYSLAWLVVYAFSGQLPYHFGQIQDKDYRVAAHCLERPNLPHTVSEPLRGLVYNWLAKNPADRLLGYDLAILFEQADLKSNDFCKSMEFRQIERECGFMHLAARHGTPYASYHLALRLEQQGRIPDAAYWLDKAARSGYAVAARRLALILGKHHEMRDKVRADQLLRQAADSGDPGALAILGKRLTDLGKEHPSFTEGLHLLTQAAMAGHSSSQYELHRILRKLPGHEDAAAAYLTMAADRGHPKAPPYWQVPE